jgi:DNA-binding GntR family transcriptional regulator
MPLPLRRRARPRTKQQFVYKTLRRSIMRCELQPGERLVIDALARKLEVSAIPVREALRVLQSEGLVQNVPHVGATVAPLSRDSIVELFTIMEGLEAVATRAAAQNATPRDVAALAEVAAAMDKALDAKQYEEWAELNTEFHLSFSRVAVMPLLEQMMARVLDRWDRVRRHYFNGVLLPRMAQAQSEHHELVDAMRRRDLDALERMVRRHNQGALGAYSSHLQEHPVAESA